MQENNTIEHIQQLLDAAKSSRHLVAVSPHYYYHPWDRQWHFGGTLEEKMHEIGVYQREHPLRTHDLEGSGADFLEQYKPQLEDGETIVCSPHKIYGPQTNDLVLQLRKRGITKVLLAGMSANLCTESHLRELIEQGFDVTVVKDATAAAKHPELGDGYQAALINFAYIASNVIETKDALDQLHTA